MPTTSSNRRRRLAARLGLSFGVALLLVLVLEATARLAWVDQYALQADRAVVEVFGARRTTRMHARGLALSMHAGGIYPGGQAVHFAIGHDGALAGAARAGAGAVFALGGSTTECALVPEGQRWPDLLSPPATNFGVSGNTSMHSLCNLVSLLPRAPARVLVMHGYNDVLALTRRGADLDLAGLDGGAIDLYATERPAGWLAGSRAFRLLSHLRGEWFGRHYLGHYRAFVASQQGRPWLDDAGFAELEQLVATVLLPQRRRILAEMATRCATAASELVLLTQPHSYGAPVPGPPELRTSFLWRDHRLTFPQCKRLLDAVNAHTLATGRALSVRVVDVAAALLGRDAGALFYDQVHYTPEGCRAVADALR